MFPFPKPSPLDLWSKKLRDIGSDYYRSRKFLAALICYNKSLCYATRSELKALAFANRSAVYFEDKKYQWCLDNIQLARDHEYPTSQISTLDVREETCRNLMEAQQPNPKDDPWNFFKLTYPANDQLPNIVECLELKTNVKYGRHIVTKQALKPGDIICIEEPFFMHLKKTQAQMNCANCLNSNGLSLIPCPGQCVDTMFCSDECMNSAQQLYHKYECTDHKCPLDDLPRLLQRMFLKSVSIAGSLKELHDMIKRSESDTFSIFDFDMSNPEAPEMQKKQLRAYLSLMAKPGGQERVNDVHVQSLVEQSLRKFWNTAAERKSLVDSLHKLLEIKEWNSSSVEIVNVVLSRSDVQKIGSINSLFGSLLNHSCDPNVEWINVGNKMVVVVQLPIKTGEQLFVSYRSPFYTNLSRFERQLILSRDYFICDCIACNSGWTLSGREKATAFRAFVNDKSSDPIGDFKKNCNYIQQNFKIHPSHNIAASVLKNSKYLAQIAASGSVQN